MQMPLNYTEAQRNAKIKEVVRAQLDLTKPIYEVSKERWEYDAGSDGAWTIHEETVARDPDSGQTEVLLDRRVGMAPVSVSKLPFAELLLVFPDLLGF